MAGATVSIHVVCLCRWHFFRLVGFIFAPVKALNKEVLFIRRTDETKEDGRPAKPWRFYSFATILISWRQKSWSNASLYVWRGLFVSGYLCSDGRITANISRFVAQSFIGMNGFWSCSLANLSPCPPTLHLAHIIRPTPSSHPITNAAQKGFQEIHRRRGRPSAP